MSIISYIQTMERRKLLIWGSVGVVSLIVIIVIIVVSIPKSSTVSKGSDALSNVPLIDGHNDLANNLRELLKNKLNDFKFQENLEKDPLWGSQNCSTCNTDLPRLKQGKVGAQFWAVWVNCTTQYKDAVAETLEQIDVIKRLIKKYPNDMEFVVTADGIMNAFNNKKIGSLIGVEGGHSIDSRLGVLRTYYDLGVRYMTLTHTCNTPWADASPNTDKPNHNLTEFGMTIVKEMNRLGMMVDLSHVSHNVMREAIEVSKAPVIFSHSNAYTIFNHFRNVPDDVLHVLKQKDGIVMVNFYPNFLASSNATISTVMEHINYIANVSGVDHVGIGADFDGIPSTATGLEDVSKYTVLFDTLHSAYPQMWSISNLEKLAGKNLLRVFKKVEEIRDKLATEKTNENWISQDMLHIPENLTICRNVEDVDK